MAIGDLITSARAPDKGLASHISSASWPRHMSPLWLCVLSKADAAGNGILMRHWEGQFTRTRLHPVPITERRI